MWKQLAIIGLTSLAMTGAASAQDANASKEGTFQKAVSAGSPEAEREALYNHAALVAARAGVSSDAELSREELFSILLVVSLKQSNKPHPS